MRALAAAADAAVVCCCFFFCEELAPLLRGTCRSVAGWRRADE